MAGTVWSLSTSQVRLQGGGTDVTLGTVRALPSLSPVWSDRALHRRHALGCSPRSTSNLLERSLFIRTDEEYELRLVVRKACATTIAPPKRHACQSGPAALSSTLLPSSAPHVLRMHHPDAAQPVQSRHASDAPAPRRAGWEARVGPRAAAWRGTGQLRPAADRRRRPVAREAPKATPSSIGACGDACCGPQRRRRRPWSWLGSSRTIPCAYPFIRTRSRRRRCSRRRWAMSAAGNYWRTPR